MISTKTNTKIKETVVKEVSAKMRINKRHVKTHVKIDMDGKTVWDEEGHSLVSNFGRYLEFLMCGASPEAYTHYNFASSGTVSRSNGKLSIILTRSIRHMIS
jgi:hypothetical protein